MEKERSKFELKKLGDHLKFSSQIINVKSVDHIYISVEKQEDKIMFYVVFDFVNKSKIKLIFKSKEDCEEFIEEIYTLLVRHC